MALFQPSTKTHAEARQEVGETIGASALGTVTGVSGAAARSINAAFEHFNNLANWEFTLTEHFPIPVFAPFNVTGVSASAGQTSAAMPAGHGILIDDVITFGGLVAGTRVSATAAGSVGFNSTITTAITGSPQVVTAGITRDFYDLPTDWKQPYSTRLYGAQTTLRLIRRRIWDRSIVDEFVPSTPLYYDVFGIGGKGKIRLLPPPAGNDTLGLRYYRRMGIASATAMTLDIPQDYEPYVMAWAKWHFLMDKEEGRSQQGSTWLAFAQDGIKTMMGSQTRIPDEDLGFTPGHFAYDPARGPNSTRHLFDEYY